MKTPCLLLASLLLAAGVRAAEAPLRIDPAQSRVEVAVKATADSFVGALDAYAADIRMDTDTGKVASARFDFHFSDVKTGKTDRDAAMHEWQDTPAHPDGVFVLAEIGPDAKTGANVARGTLEFHGVSHEIRFPVSITTEAGRCALDGEAVVDTRQFGLPIIRKLLVLKVDPEVRVRFHLQGELRPE